MEEKIDRNVAESLINILRGCHQMIKTSLVHNENGELYDEWSEKSDDTIVTMIYHLADAAGFTRTKPISNFTNWEFDDPTDHFKGMREVPNDKR